MVQEERSRRKANPYIAAYLRGRMSSAASDEVSFKSSKNKWLSNISTVQKYIKKLIFIKRG